MELFQVKKINGLERGKKTQCDWSERRKCYCLKWRERKTSDIHRATNNQTRRKIHIELNKTQLFDANYFRYEFIFLHTVSQTDKWYITMKN